MVHVLGVSMPRSGHHLLEMILKNTLRDKFSYCEFYEQGCCKSIPCTSEDKMATQEAGVFMQKSHDFEFKDPLVVAGTHRVVQYRTPVPRALSNYELHLKNGAEDTLRNFRNFLVNEALYFTRFYKKWLTNRSKEFLLVGYEELTSHPLKMTLDFFDHIAMPIDVDRVTEGVAQSVVVRGRDNTAFVYSNVFSHRYANYPVLANFEDLVIRNCPGYYPTRYFSAARSPESLIGLLFGARQAIDEGNRTEAVALAEAAGKQDPNDPMVKRILRLALAVGGGTDAAGPAEDANRLAGDAPGQTPVSTEDCPPAANAGASSPVVAPGDDTAAGLEGPVP
jgi:hypothetical protein